LTEGKGLPIAIVIAGANEHDMTLLGETLDAIVIERPIPNDDEQQHLCGDKGFDYNECREEAEGRGYVPHIRSRNEEKKEARDIPGYQPRRWVVEVCHSWLNRFRKILVRFEKDAAMHLGLLQFACAYIVFKKAFRF
jgi:putative transposase